jgi:hypothetical protein
MADIDPRERNVWAPTQFLTRETKRPGLLVVIAGLLTTAATLGLLSIGGHHGFNPMGFYVNLIPVGALLVGLLAASGYGLASWLTGAKIGRGLLIVVASLQIVGYFAAQYVEFAQLRATAAISPDVDFLTYFDVMTQSFTLRDSRNTSNEPATPWGAWGYLLRLAEVAGFAAGGVIAPAMLFSVPYCDECQVYMKTSALGRFTAGARTQKIGKRKTDLLLRYQAEHKSGLEQGLKRGEELAALVKAADTTSLGDVVRNHSVRSKEALLFTNHIALDLEHCQRCHTGHVVLKLRFGKNQQGKEQELWRLPVDAAFVAPALKIDKKA